MKYVVLSMLQGAIEGLKRWRCFGLGYHYQDGVVSDVRESSKVWKLLVQVLSTFFLFFFVSFLSFQPPFPCYDFILLYPKKTTLKSLLEGDKIA